MKVNQFRSIAKPLSVCRFLTEDQATIVKACLEEEQPVILSVRLRTSFLTYHIRNKTVVDVHARFDIMPTERYSVHADTSQRLPIPLSIYPSLSGNTAYFGDEDFRRVFRYTYDLQVWNKIDLSFHSQ